jgi:hypothetical protein
MRPDTQLSDEMATVSETACAIEASRRPISGRTLPEPAEATAIFTLEPRTGKCIAVAPAEGYTESHHRPAVKLLRIPTAPTARVGYRTKELQTAELLHGRYAVGTYDGGR